MRKLTYDLKFIRPASTTLNANPIIAASKCVITITPVGVTAGIGTLGQYETASLQTHPKFNKDGSSFTETGTVTFGESVENNLLHFSTIGLGYIHAYPCPAPYTAGTVMWKIEEGEGFFEGANGAITSNFLIDLSNKDVAGELIAYQFAVVYLP
jgi:hypothetical protein